MNCQSYYHNVLKQPRLNIGEIVLVKNFGYGDFIASMTNGYSTAVNRWISRSEEEMSVIASIDDTPKWGKLLHVSIARRDRHPNWDEIVSIKQLLFGPDADTMMVIPRNEDYVNLHAHCFHLWQTPETWGLK